MKLQRGINLGGFLSQCEHSEEHYNMFIGEKDLEKIAGFGFDHVRLPVDYEVFEQEDATERPEGYERVRRVIEWCEKYGLNLVLDLHKTYGYDFNAAMEEGNSLFEDEKLQERFLHLWKRIAEHFGNLNNVAFELLNEVVEKENADKWNQLIQRAVRQIREITKDTVIIYGGIQWNSVKTLKLLEKPADENIMFTFHFYEPLIFTHQKAYWVKNMNPDEDIFYPESMDYYDEKSKPLGYQGEVARFAKAKEMGVPFIEEMVSEAVKVSEKYNVTVYCGEYGVIDRAPLPDTIRWFQDVHQVFREHGFGFAMWNYKNKDFGITDEHFAPIQEEVFATM